MLDHRFSANPIARAELTYQTRSRPQVRRWKRVTTRLILILALTLACILAGGEFAGALLYRDPDPISRAFGVLNILPVATAFILHFVLMIQTLSLSANSVAREKQANNWDMLVLTGVDSRQIIRGKWWATVRRMWPMYAFLGILRAAVIMWIGASVSRVFVYSYPVAPNIHIPTPLHFLVSAASVFILTMLNLPFTAACGVSAFNKRSSIGLARAIATRLFIISGISLITVFTGWLLFRASYNTFQDIGARVLLAVFDNGVNFGSELVTYRYDSRNTYYVNISLAALLLTLATYILLTLLLLRLAQWQATCQNALPPLSSTGAKTPYNG